MIDMNIRTYGTDERLGFCREYLLEKKLTTVSEIILLPIPSTRDGVTVAGLGKTPIELLGGRIYSGVVAGYGIPKAFKEELAELGLSVADVSLDEQFVQDNASLTAVGAVGKILTESNAVPKNLSIGIIGYGRIGKRLLELLLFLGARVIIFTSKEGVRRELCAHGISALPYEALSKVSEGVSLDILINTAPAPIISNEAIAAFEKTKLIELASGYNFPESASVTRLMQLPAKMYPRSAGRVLGNSILRMLGEQI